MGEVGPAILIKDLATPRIHHRTEKLLHVLTVDRLHLQFPERPLDSQDRRLANLHVKVRPLVLDQLAEDLVDFQLATIGD